MGTIDTITDFGNEEHDDAENCFTITAMESVDHEATSWGTEDTKETSPFVIDIIASRQRFTIGILVLVIISVLYLLMIILRTLYPDNNGLIEIWKHYSGFFSNTFSLVIGYFLARNIK